MNVKIKNTQPSMKDLLTHVKEVVEFNEGDSIKGKVLSVSKNEVLVDVPNVGLGVVRGKELYNEEYLSGIKAGADVEAILIDMDNEKDMMELSFRAIGRDKIWTDIKHIFENKVTVDAKIRDANRGGFLVRVQGVDGFLPASLLSPMHAVKQSSIEDKSLLSQMKKYVGQNFQVKVISINEEGDSLIVSEKGVTDELAKEKLSKYKIGNIVEGTVVGTVDFGVFIRFDEELEGLVHISEIAWKKIEDPRSEFKLGQKFKAKIVEIDNENRINLSIKQLLPNPWVDFAKKTKPGDKFVGKVSKIVAYGAIVVNSEDIQGLCHITQMVDEAIENPSEIHNILKIGETKEFTVLGVDVDEKLYLTLLDFKKAQKVQEELIKAGVLLEQQETEVLQVSKVEVEESGKEKAN